ncbi:hypothetical protein FACS1894127_5380 [Clostridia bacterium]|nr:hypothetical protein FACS1894127_5380 [Clostridia bacterium]
MVAGYFVVNSYERKGFAAFFRDRFIRLGIPVLFTMLIITPITGKILFNDNWLDPPFSFLDLIKRILNGVGVMWFAELLLLFSLFYGLTQIRLFKKFIDAVPKSLEITLIREFGLILVMAVLAFIIRFWFPADQAIFGLRFGNFSSYTLLFFLGVLAHKSNLLDSISYVHGIRWLAAGILIGLGGGAALFILGGGTMAFNIFGVRLVGYEIFQGGLTLQSAAYTLWDSFVAVSMSIGLLALFKEKFNFETPLSKTLAKDAFAVYMFHLPIVMGATILIEPLPLLPIVKFILLCVLLVPLCFALSHYVFRKIPLLGKLL